MSLFGSNLCNVIYKCTLFGSQVTKTALIVTKFNFISDDFFPTGNCIWILGSSFRLLFHLKMLFNKHKKFNFQVEVKRNVSTFVLRKIKFWMLAKLPVKSDVHKNSDFFLSNLQIKPNQSNCGLFIIVKNISKKNCLRGKASILVIRSCSIFKQCKLYHSQCNVNSFNINE